MAAGTADAAFNFVSLGGKGVVEGGLKEGIKAGVKELTKEGGEKVGANMVKDAAGEVKAVKKGGESAAAARGREAHKEFAEKVKNKPGWQSEPRLTDPKTGKIVKPDAVTPSGRPVELKPNTPSGVAQGERQLPKYERATGKEGKVIYYEPKK
jgi:hypothetical protein